MKHTKIAVIGAGASGLMAAYKAASTIKAQGKKTSIIVLEGNPKAGKKLLATGNGRCNLTNANITAKNYHGDSLAKDIIVEFSHEKIIDEFEKLGILCHTDDCGRVYPANFQAAAVLKGLRLYCEENGIDFIYNFITISIKKEGKDFLIKSQSGEKILAERCIIASGGQASPSHSCIINGYDLAKSLGHKITELSPALSPVICSEKHLSSLKGMRCKAAVKLVCKDKVIFTESGEVIFGDKWISGICIFNLSIILTDYIRDKVYKNTKLSNFTISLDLAEDMNEEEIMCYLKGIGKSFPNRSIGDLLVGLLNMKIGEVLLKSLGFNLAGKISSLKDEGIDLISKTIKKWCFKVKSLPDWSKAQVTAGGVPLNEIDIKTCESKKAKGLYICGEILDVHGDCGGYNLHFAWATGIIAGESSAKII